MFSRFRLATVGLLVLLVAAIGIAAAACGDDDDADAQDGVTQEQLDEVALAAQRAHVLATMTTIRTEGLHEIDEASVRASEIEAGWSGAVTRIRQAVAGTPWPDDFTEITMELETQLVAAEDAISSDDLPATKTAISLAHAAWHDLEHDAYSFIAGEEHSADDGHDDSNDDHAASSPTSSAMQDDGDNHDDSTSGDDHSDSGMTHTVIELTDADVIPTVRLVVHDDAKAGWNLEIVTTNWDWAPEHASTAPIAGEGHAHVYVDGVKLGRVYGEWYHLASLDAGDHEVMITLNANDHSDLSYNGTMIAAKQMVHVEAS